MDPQLPTEGTPTDVALPEGTQVEPYDSTELVGEVNAKYAEWRQAKRPFEVVWFINGAMVRGQQDSKWNPMLNQLEPRKTPAHRERSKINFILSKVRARLAKFIQNRPQPEIIPASTDREDVLNAKATQKALDYLWRKLDLDTAYEEAVMWAMTCGKSFWWIRWNPDAKAKVKIPAQSPWETDQVVNVPVGDVEIDVGTAFELLVSDLGITRIEKQPEIMRVKMREVAEIERRYPHLKDKVEGDSTSDDLFQYQKQIAEIGARQITGISSSAQRDGFNADPKKTHVAVKELFTKPCALYPDGRYVVVVGDQLAKMENEIPGGFGENHPYPVVEFFDMLTAGQFWPTTIVEQLIGLQQEYNDLRSKVREQLKMQMHPKLMVPKQANLAKNAYNSEAAEKIEFHFIPGMPSPYFLVPPSVAADTWRTLEVIRAERDEITNIYPSSVGAVGQAESGFQTNLLQEAADAPHIPDIRRNKKSIEWISLKMRRLMAQGYDIPRLISVAGRQNTPDVFEFHQSQIDENAEIKVLVETGLPSSKAARVDILKKMGVEGWFGDFADPVVKSKVLSMMDIGSSEAAAEEAYRDESQARLENLDFSRNAPVEPPMPWENHDLHYSYHTDLLKSAEIKMWSPEQRATLIKHVILHAKWINPENAMMLANHFGFTDIAAEIAPLLQPPQAEGGVVEGEVMPQQGQLPPAQDQSGGPILAPALPVAA